MFRLGRHHARLSQWHRDPVEVDNVAVNARRRDVAARVKGPLRDEARSNVVHVNDPVLRRARRVPRSHSVENRSRDVRRFERC